MRSNITIILVIEYISIFLVARWRNVFRKCYQRDTTDNCPLVTVENIGFCALMKATASRYKIPSRRTITRLMDDKYEHLHEIFKREIARATELP